MKRKTPAEVNGPITEYVLGLLFRNNYTSLVLIRKAKPSWQAGLLNGIGGKIEFGETPIEAMVREFKEETGVDTSQSGWRQFCEMSGKQYVVYCFIARDSKALKAARTVEGEVVVKAHPNKLCRMKCVSNLTWLVAMARDENYGKEFYATVRYSAPWSLRPEPTHAQSGRE